MRTDADAGCSKHFWMDGRQLVEVDGDSLEEIYAKHAKSRYFCFYGRALFLRQNIAARGRAFLLRCWHTHVHNGAHHPACPQLCKPAADRWMCWWWREIQFNLFSVFSAGKKRKADASDSDSDSEEEEAPKKKKKDKKSKKQEAKAEEADSEEEAATKSETPAKAEEEEAEVAEGTPGSKKGGSKTNTPFQRITNDQVYAKVKGGQAEKDRLLDNTFESKSGDGYGSVASDILIQVRGKDFRSATGRSRLL